jgi:phosphoglycerate dehydrogenase-like enzyme
MESNVFRVGLTGDFVTPSGELAMGDAGLERLRDAPNVAYEIFGEHFPEVTPAQVAGCDAVLAMGPKFTRQTVSDPNLKLGIVARFGVGYDTVDVDALTERDVVLTITPDGVRRPVAAGVVSLILALTHQLFAKDRLVREGRWAERTNIKAEGVTGRVLGMVGIGNIGAEVLRLIRPFEMRHLAFDPYINPADVADLGVEMVSLETVMRQSDFVSVNCPLNEQTRRLIGERELSWMMPSAYFINTARGPVVDQTALYEALKERRIRGAGLDVFATEPIPRGDPLLTLDNVILTPHSLCWTDECFRMISESAVQSALDFMQGEVPKHVVNRKVLDRPGFRAKLEENRRRWNSASKATNA